MQEKTWYYEKWVGRQASFSPSRYVKTFPTFHFFQPYLKFQHKYLARRIYQPILKLQILYFSLTNQIAIDQNQIIIDT